MRSILLKFSKADGSSSSPAIYKTIQTALKALGISKDSPNFRIAEVIPQRPGFRSPQWMQTSESGLTSL